MFALGLLLRKESVWFSSSGILMPDPSKQPHDPQILEQFWIDESRIGLIFICLIHSSLVIILLACCGHSMVFWVRALMISSLRSIPVSFPPDLCWSWSTWSLMHSRIGFLIRDHSSIMLSKRWVGGVAKCWCDQKIYKEKKLCLHAQRKRLEFS